MMFNSKRKKEHLEIVRTKNTSSNTTNGFEDVLLVPATLPELDFNEIDLSTKFLGKDISAPLLISSMTGGTEEALKINRTLALAAQKYNIPLALGSQKAMIYHPEVSHTYKVRDIAPDIILIGNIGIDYLLSEDYSYKKLIDSCNEIGINALYIHINPLQELAQPEGFKSFKGAYDKIKAICKTANFPILAKEVGDGISPKASEKLAKAGVYAIDVAGSGGTSWSAVEGFRGSPIGESFRNWGLSTALSLITTKDRVQIPVISSGGIRNGQEIAKSIALGADIAGIAKPLGVAAMRGEKFLDKEINRLLLELKTTMILVGAKNVQELKKTPALISGELKDLSSQLINKY